MLFKTILHRLGSIDKNQRGFTLIELLVVLAITGLIGTGVAMSISQVVNTNACISSHMIAITQVENAGYWISRDALVAQRIVTDDDTETAETEVLTLAWVGREYQCASNTCINTYEVRYTYADSDQLWRHQEVTIYDSSGHLVGTDPSQMLVAKYTAIAANYTAFTPSMAGSKLVVLITASVGEIEAERTYEITPRIQTK